MDKKCLICGNVFTPRNAQAKYCCNECRYTAKRNTTKRWYESCGKKSKKAVKNINPASQIHLLPQKPPKGYKSWAEVEVQREANKYEDMISRVTNYASSVPAPTHDQRVNSFHKLVEQTNKRG